MSEVIQEHRHTSCVLSLHPINCIRHAHTHSSCPQKAWIQCCLLGGEVLLLGRKQKQGDGECSPKWNSRQEREGFGERKKNGGEGRNTGKLWVEKSFIRPLEGACWGICGGLKKWCNNLFAVVGCRDNCLLCSFCRTLGMQFALKSTSVKWENQSSLW